MSGYTVLVLLASILFSAYAYFSLRNQLIKAMRQTQLRRIEHIQHENLPGLIGADPAVAIRHIEQLYSPVESSRFIRVSRLGGPVLYVSGTPQDHSFDPSGVAPALSAQNEACRTTMVPANRQQLHVVACTVAYSGAGYAIEMGTPTAEADTISRNYFYSILLGLPVVAAIAGIGGAFLVRSALGPVEAIRKAAEQITVNNLRQRLPAIQTGDSIEALNSTLNQMLERLDQAYQQASRFSADASHELRTPLAIMRSELEAVVHAPNLPAALHGSLSAISNETERLSAIVEALFSVARLDAGEGKVEHKAIDLIELTRSTLDQMRLLADEKNILVEIEQHAPVWVMGDTGRLKQVIVNLLDNAIKYTTQGGTIRISIVPVNAKAVLTVADNGIGVPAQDLQHVFGRFYRAENARAMSKEGAGLGLSIVRAICVAHGGTVALESYEKEGTKVTIALPLAGKPKNGTVLAAPETLRAGMEL